MKWRFAVKFLVTFGLLVMVWWATDFAQLYRKAALATVQVLSPVVNGWWLDYDQPGFTDPVVYLSGSRQLPMLLQLPALSIALMPFISLVAATPGLGWKRAVGTAVLGSVLCFAIHVSAILVYPLVLDRPNVIKDTIGAFSGLVAFVLAPIGLWFVLTYRALRSVWQLTLDPR